MHKPILRSTVAIAFIATCFAPTFAKELDDAEVASLVKLLSPPEDAPWRTIPWKVSVLDAQGIAAKEKKPIFIWAMDGHPLGCT